MKKYLPNEYWSYQSRYVNHAPVKLETQARRRRLLFGLSRDEARLSQLELMLHAEAQWLPRWNEVVTDKSSKPVKVFLKIPALLEGNLDDRLPNPEGGVRRGS